MSNEDNQNQDFNNLSQIKQATRSALKVKRNALSRSFQRQKALEMMRHFIQHPLFLRSRKIAAYWPVEGEMDPRFILEKAWERNKKCYLPILHPYEDKHLLFSEYQSSDPLYRNRFGILEPRLNLHTTVTPCALDIVLIPLLAFDYHGRRLGRGAGFYDYTFSFLKHGIKPHPILIGLGYEFQHEQTLPHHPWDISLQGILTEKGLTLLPEPEDTEHRR